MARSFREVGGDRLLIREGGGCLSVFGLPFFGAGVFMCLATLGLVPISNASSQPFYTMPLLGLMGLLFTAVGGGLVFGRGWTTVDGTRRQVTQSYGLLWPMLQTTTAVDDLTMVSIGFEQGDSDSADQYPVTIRPASGSPRPSIKLASFTDYAASRACAAAAATCLQLPLEDATTDHARRMPASDAELSFEQRTGGSDRFRPIDPPPDGRATVTREADRVRIVIPNPPLHPVALVAMLLPLAVPLLFVAPLARFFTATRTPDVFGNVFLAFLIVGFGLLPGLSALSTWLRSRHGATIITASRDGILLEQRRVWRTRVLQRIVAADILDLDFSTRDSAIASARLATEQRLADAGRPSSGSTVGPRVERMIVALSRYAKGRGVIVKTRQGLESFGAGLSDDEVRYLHAVVSRAIR